MLSSPACWAAFGEVLMREYQDRALFTACHRLTVDAYALQHPGRADDRRAERSVWLHFASPHAIFDLGYELPKATTLLQRLATKDFPPLPILDAMWEVTMLDVQAAPAEDHVGSVGRWARSAYEDWTDLLTTRTREILNSL